MDEFESRVRFMGFKLFKKRLMDFGSPEAFIRAHTKSVSESVKSGVRVFRDILLVRMLEIMSPEFRNRPHRDRKFFIYTEFLNPLKKYYIFKGKDGRSIHSY